VQTFTFVSSSAVRPPAAADAPASGDGTEDLPLLSQVHEETGFPERSQCQSAQETTQRTKDDVPCNRPRLAQHDKPTGAPESAAKAHFTKNLQI